MAALMESHCLSFREIPHTAKLYSAFLEDFSRVSAYYVHPPTAAGIGAAAREVRLDAEVRAAVVGILREQNRRFGPGGGLDRQTARNLDRLAAGAVAIVTGQQVGLFSGPAYTIYKALSAIRCAEETTRRGMDAVPVFWLASEDHDLAEINQSSWVTRNGLARYELPVNEADVGRRVGEIVLGKAIEPLVSQAAATLEGEGAETVARAMHESYGPAETFSSAFAKLMARLLAGRGIIFLDPLDARLHRLTAPVFRRAVREAGSLRDALLARSSQLEGAGLHAQVKVTPETTLLFSSASGRREPVRSRDSAFVIGEVAISERQLGEAIEKTPEVFSPSALFRPVVQDTLLPTAAYIGGPAEVAYMAQAHVVYERILGRMPAILPRASFTLVEPPMARFLAQYSLEIRDFFAGPQELRAKMEQKSVPGELAARFDAAEASLRSLLHEFEEPIARLDSTLVDALRSTEGRVIQQFTQLRAKVARAENFRSGVLDRHQRILLDALYPEGGLQERTLCALPFLATHGPALLDQLSALSSMEDSAGGRSCAQGHQTIFL